MHNAVDVAGLIIAKYNQKHSSPMNITKLHKLLYVVYGVYLSEQKTTLFNEEPLCLPYGPVFDSLYQMYKYGDIDLNNNDTCESDSSAVMSIVKRVVNSFGKHSAKTLSEWSHRSGSAWDKTIEKNSIWGYRINEKYIRQEFDAIRNGHK